MVTHVACQRAFTTRFVWAQVALEWFFTSMHLYVTLELAVVCKFHQTAFEALFSTVFTHVFFQLGLELRYIGAQVAAEQLHSVFP